MEKFGLPKKEEGMSGVGKAALLAGAIAAAGAVYEYNDTDAPLEPEAVSHSQVIENGEEGAPLQARESIPLEAFYAVDEYKSILGDTWSIRSVPGVDSEQDRMQAAIAEKHGVSFVEFTQAFEYKLRDEGLE